MNKYYSYYFDTLLSFKCFLLNWIFKQLASIILKAIG